MPAWPWNRSSRRRAEARVASAQPLTGPGLLLLNTRRTEQAWQDAARHYARTIGVVRIAHGAVADSASRCPLIPERLVDPVMDRWEPDDSDPVVARVLQSYRNERDDTPELVRKHVWHHQVPGECYQTVEQRAEGADPEWFIWGQRAVRLRGRMGVVVMELPNGTPATGGAREVPVEQVRRLWTPDEDWPLLATSPMVGILDDCERYQLLGRRTKREAKSSLGMNGLLWTPSEAHRYETRPDGSPDRYSRLERDLAAVGERAWDDDDSPAATLPFSVSYGTEKSQPPAWVEVGKALDGKVMEAREEALQCIARGLPQPKMLVLQEDANHWNFWGWTEEGSKAVDAVLRRTHHGDLTDSVLRPTLRSLRQAARWGGDPEVWRVGYDLTPIIIHPDKAERAVSLYQLGVLSPVSLLTETGFGPEDAPTREELDRFVQVQQAIRTRALGEAPVGPATVRELPPAPALSSLAPYPSELAGWLD